MNRCAWTFRRSALLALAAGFALAGCKTTAPEEGRTVLSTRSGETLIQVTESDEGGGKVVRVKTQFRGEEANIVLNIDEPTYEVEIPLSIDQVQGVGGGGPAAAQAGAAGGGSGNFADLLAAQYLEKAQEHMLNGDYNAALRQVDLVLTVQPDNVQALTMKGSIYYAMGNYQLANQTWEQVLVLDPSNQEVRDFQDYLKAQRGARQPNPPSGTPGAAPQPPGASQPGTAPAGNPPATRN